jgi:hypothetical protein
VVRSRNANKKGGIFETAMVRRQANHGAASPLRRCSVVNDSRRHDGYEIEAVQTFTSVLKY